MRLLLRWCGVEASPRRPPTQAAAGGLPDQRRFRGRRAPGVAPAPLLPAPVEPLLPFFALLFFAVPFVAEPFGLAPFADAGACLRMTGLAPGFFAGGSVLDPHIVQKLVDYRSRKPGSTVATLTPAELDVLRWMAEGKSNAAIAAALSMSVATVERRINVLFQKLGLSEESDLNRRVSAVLIYLRASPPGL